MVEVCRFEVCGGLAFVLVLTCGVLVYYYIIYYTLLLLYITLYIHYYTIYYLIHILYTLPLPNQSSSDLIFSSILPNHSRNTCRYLHILIYIQSGYLSSLLLFLLQFYHPILSSYSPSFILYLSVLTYTYLYSSFLYIPLLPLPIFILYLSVLTYTYLCSSSSFRGQS